MSTQLRGVYVAGAQWACTAGPSPREGRDYLWVSHQDIDCLVTVTPLDQTKAFRARNKTSFGVCVRRDRSSTSRAKYPLRVRELTG